MKEEIKIIKIGGEVINSPEKLEEFLDSFSKIKEKKILVHGGGKKATEISKKLGIESQMIAGRRITSKEEIPIISMVYAGLINKNIVSQLQKNGVDALGLSGTDCNIIKAIKRDSKPFDYGYAGDIIEINSERLFSFLKMGICPVICSLTHDKNGQLLNTNADSIAMEVAVAMQKHYEVSLHYCFEEQGVLENIDKKDSVVEILTPKLFTQMIQKQKITAGMLPKLKNAFQAKEKGAKEVTINHFSFFKEKESLHTLIQEYES